MIPRRRLTAFFFVLFCCCTQVWSQQPVDVRTIDDDGSYLLRPTIATATDTALFPFHRYDAWNKGRTIDGQAYSLNFCLTNSGSKPKNVVLMLGNNTIQLLELFREQQGRFVSYGITGNSLPVHKRPHRSFLFYYNLRIEAGQQASYHLVFNSIIPPSYLPLLVLHPETFQYKQDRIFILFGIFAGCILLTAFFNLFLYFFIRDRIHLYYFFYALINCLFLLAWENMDMQLLYPSEPFVSRINKVTYACLSLLMCIVIMQAFLNQTKGNSRFYTLNQVNKWLLAGFIVPNILIHEFSTSLLVQQARVYLFQIIIISGIIGIILASFEKYRQGKQFALFYLAAIGTMFLGGVAVILKLVFQSGYVALPPNLLEVGIVLETVIISFGLLYRYNLFKKENEQLVLALETEKVRSAELIITTQESEQKRIAEDLHDELGGNLAALKMNLQALPVTANTAGMISLLDKTAESARHIAHNLMPPEFERTSLERLLHSYCERLNSERKTRFQFIVSGSRQDFSKQNSLMIYRIVLELINNIIRHAQATEATIQLVYFDSHLEVVAEDNGVGFSEHIADGIGLRNIRSRVQYLEGNINIDSNSHGTTIVIQVPFKK